MMSGRIFVLGSEWVYLKMYTGIKTSDMILEEAVKPLVEYLFKEGYISEWFFIRYNDPKFHLRLRFKLNKLDDYNELVGQINGYFQPYFESGEISDFLVDTYKREIERYGQHTIEDAERLFSFSSTLVMESLNFNDEEKMMTALFYIDQILEHLKLSNEEKLEWIKNFNHAFKKEFNADKNLNSQLDKKYRAFRPIFLEFLESEEFVEERSTIANNVNCHTLVLENIILHHQNKSLGISLQIFFQSIFHMHINRLFVSNQRLFEMVIYDYLFRYYKSIVARAV